MKVKLLILFLVISVFAAGQSVVPIKGDSIIISKTGGYAELVVRNKTKDTINGIMVNTGNGVIAFKRIRAINDTQFVIGTDTIKLRGVGVPLYGRNGITKVVDSFQLGGTLKQTTTINNSGYMMEFTNATSVVTLRAQNSSTGYAMEAIANTGIGINGSSVSSYGVYATSASGIALYAYTTNGTKAAQIEVNSSTMNTVLGAMSIKRTTSNTATSGIGLSIDFYNEQGSGVHTNISNQLISKLTNVTSLTSAFEIWGVNAGTLGRKMLIDGSGQITLVTEYGTGSFTGIPSKFLGVTSSGAIIAVDTAGFGGGGGSGSTDSLATLLNAPGPGEVLLNTDAIDTLLIKRLIAGSNITLTPSAYGITISSSGGGGGSGDTANLIFDTIPDGTTLPTAVFQAGNILRTRGFRDTTGSTWGINGRGEIYVIAAGGGGGGSGWDPAGNTLAGAGILGSLNTQEVHFYTNNVKRMELATDGDLSYNANSSVNGYGVYINDTLQVQAIRILANNLMMSGTGSNALFGMRTVDNLSTTYSVMITNQANTSLLRLANDGAMTGAFGALQPTLWSPGGATVIFRPSNGTTTTGNFIHLSHLNATAATSGNIIVVRTSGNLNPGTGTATMTSLQVSPIIAQTGSATGKSISLQIAPTLTSYADHTLLQITASTDVLWPVLSLQQNRVNTTNATTTTLHTYPTEAASLGTTSYVIEATVVGHRTGGVSGSAGDAASYRYLGRFKRVSGTVSLIGETFVFADESQPAWNVSATISGTNILLQVTGAAGNDISWALTKSEIHKKGD